jgi:hypothetical protein
VALSDYPESLPHDATALRVEASVACPLSLVVDEAHVIFPLLEAPSPGVRVELRDLGVPLGLGLSHRVVTTFRRECDLQERGRPHDEIVFGWDADSFLLPNFSGTLRFRVDTVDRTRLLLEGSYVPPFGAAGAMFDRVAGRRLALATLERIVHRLADQLESLWTAERASAPRLPERFGPVA